VINNSNNRLLLADDDEMLTALLQYRLEKEGYYVQCCNDGREVKAQLGKSVPDIIVSDIMMPYFSGLELIDYVRKELALDVPILIMSSAGNDENIIDAFDLGANDFLSKPISPSELIVRLMKELNKT